MSDVKIITNNQYRTLLYGNELTEKEVKQFDYLEDVMGGNFFRYLGTAYDLGEFMSLHNSDDFKGWDGYSGDTFFSGILVEYDGEDTDRIKVGRYYS